MCGRATLVTPIDEIAEQLGVEPIDAGPPRYNIAPGTPLLVVRVPRDDARNELALVKWGLEPFWTRDQKRSKPFIQARAETVETAAPYRRAFESHRCLVVVDGFYEWSTPARKGGPRQPHHVHRPDGGVFTLAGLWERYRADDGHLVETCAVVTTGAQGEIQRLHDRMPLVVAPPDRETWLRGAPAAAHELIAGAPVSQRARAAELRAEPVSLWVNDVKHDDPRCLAPAALAEPVDTHEQIGLPFK
jgi:putative SOS response-associated peptidase YedK